MRESTEPKYLLLTILAQKEAYSEKKAVKGSELAKMLNTSPREINNLSRELRKDGYRCISSKSSSGGYWISNDLDEMSHFYKSHKSQSDKHLEECNLTNSLIINLMDENTKRGINNLYPTKKTNA